MAQKLGPLDICCDAPPYNIVKGCALIGIQTPEDVRWLRTTTESSEPQRRGSKQPKGQYQIAEDTDTLHCPCGELLEPLQAYTFQLLSGEEVAYAVGQCKRCRTVHWDIA